MATFKELLEKEREKIKRELKDLKLEDAGREIYLNGILRGLNIAEKLEYTE